MSNLHLLARRCPIMGKALAVQSARLGGAIGRGVRTHTTKAGMHTASAVETAAAVDMGLFGKPQGIQYP